MKTLNLFSLGLIGVLALSGCTGSTAPKASAPLRVDTLVLSAPQQVVNRQFNGQVAVADLTHMAFRIEGKLDSLNALPGQAVKQGQILARLDDAIARQRWQDAQAKEELLQRQWARSEPLLDKGLIAQSEFDELTANLRLARVTLKSAEANLGYTELRAPFDGIVDTLEKQAFETVTPGETVLSLYRTDRIDVELQIPDTLLSHAVGFTPALEYRPQVRVKGSDTPLSMRYLEHSLRPDPVSGSYVARLSLDGPMANLMPGQPVEVALDFRKAGFPVTSGFLVPLNALQAREFDQGFRLWRLVGEQVEPLKVNVVEMSQEGALIVGSLKTGDQIVTTSLAQLRPGRTVKLVKKD